MAVVSLYLTSPNPCHDQTFQTAFPTICSADTHPTATARLSADS